MSFIDAFARVNRDEIKPVYSGQRKLNVEKLRQSPMKESIKNELLAIFPKVKYFTFDETIEKLEISIQEALDTIEGNFYLAFEHQRFNSELLFTAYFWYLIKDRVIDILPLVEIPKNNNVLFIDDFVLTGTSLSSSVVDQFKYETKRKDLKFYASIVASSVEGTRELNSFGVKIFSQDTFNLVETSPELTLDCHIGGTYELGFGESIYPFFSDHKISNIIVNLPNLFHYGRIGDLEIGCLITYPPDELIKKVIWEKYFRDLIAEPKIFNYDS